MESNVGVGKIRGAEFTSQTSAEAHRLGLERARADAEERRAKALMTAATAGLILEALDIDKIDIGRVLDGAVAKVAMGVLNGQIPVRNGGEAASVIEKFTQARIRILGEGGDPGVPSGDLSQEERLQNAIEIRDAAARRAAELAAAQEDHGPAPAPT